MFNFFNSKKKNEKPVDPVVEKDWKAISERLEKKITVLENEIREKVSSLQQKDKQIVALQEEAETQKRLFQQEKRWREKEETDSKKDKEREKDILNELKQARDSWQKQQALRIQFEQEAREIRTQKDNLMLEYQQTVNTLKQKEKEIAFLVKDLKTLNYQNIKLQRKKQADQWVSKNDFVRLEKILKRERRQLVLFKTQVPQSAWPKELRPVRENKPEPLKTSSSVQANENPPEPLAEVNTESPPEPLVEVNPENLAPLPSSEDKPDDLLENKTEPLSNPQSDSSVGS